MADTPLIRAARALSKAESGEDRYDALDGAMQLRLQVSVRAVLEAVREPSEAMAEAGSEIVKNVHAEESDAAFASDAANTWRFMIDAVLEQK